MQLDKSIQNLTELAADLNKASDDVQSIIKDMEAKLQTTNIGITAWSPGMVDASTDETGISLGYKIGWSRVGSEWRLAFKQATEREVWADSVGEAITDTRDVTEPQPLANAPRIVRIEAVGCFESIVDQLSIEASRHLQVLTHVRKFVYGPDVAPADTDVPF